jgi:membrane protease YdiL (CAAX protease family)
MADFAQTVFVSVICMLGMASLAVWGAIFARWRTGQPILIAEPREPVPWRAIDLYLLLILYIALQVACAKLVITWASLAPGDARDDSSIVAILLSNALASALLIGLAAIYLRLRCGPSVGDLGFLPWRPGIDLRLGLVTFLAALVPVFTIQFLLTRLVPTEHPVQLLLTRDSSPQVLALCVVSAVIVAPLSEEFLFRVLLQGWLEALAMRRHGQQEVQVLTGNMVLHADLAPGPAADSSNPYASPQAASGRIEAVKGVGPALMPWPIVVSSLVFAAVHIGHGPDPVPLFVLALMLGYLYQKTHRIWPGVVVHACLNAWSLTILWISLRMGWN